MAKRINVIAAVIGLMAIGIAPVREALVGYWWSDPVQAFLQPYVEEASNRGQVATSALIQFVKAHPVKFINGVPVTTITSGSGTTTVPLDTADNWSLNHGCSLTADEVEAILKGYDSPAGIEGGFGQMTVDECKRTGIDNAYVVAMFIHESTAGTAGAAVETHSTGNIICTDGNCAGRFQRYADWKAGGRAHFTLLKCYRDGGGEGCDGLWSGKKHDTIVDALYTWAPPSDNNNQNQDCEADPSSYPCAVKKDVSNWRSVHTTVAPAIATASGAEGMRAKVIEKALSLRGIGYSQIPSSELGFRPDCSGTVSFIYKDVTGINIGSTTYDIYPNLKEVSQDNLQPGDIWFGVWEGSPPNNEHMGIVADVNGDGKWDLIHNGADKSEQHVTESFLETYLGDHTKGFRTVLGA